MTSTSTTEVTTLQRVLSGSFGGFCAILCTHPLDTIRMHIQTQKPLPSFLKLYRGLLPPLFGVLPVAGLSFIGFDLGLRMTSGVEHKGLRMILAGSLAALPPSLLTTPGERLKILLQLNQFETKRLTLIDLCKNIYHQEGIRGFYRGSVMTLLRDIPAYTVWFGSYEYFKQQLLQHQTSKDTPYWVPMLSGGLAGISQWLVCLPMDTVKTNYQQQTTMPLLEVIQSIYKQSGLAGFYRGFWVCMLRAFPANAISWLATETALKYLRHDYIK